MKKVKNLLRLDVGCGAACHQGFVGMDVRKLPGVQIVHNIESVPWPLQDETCCIVLMSHLIEHIRPQKQIAVIDECWRILEPDGHLMISTPYGGSYRYNQDPTHCAPWNEATVEYFIKGAPLYEVYKPKPWTVHSKQFFWNPKGDLEVVLRKLEVEHDN